MSTGSAMSSNKDDDWKDSFCDLATQYYIMGRSAAKAFLIPIYGNQLHHAVEMYVKAVLVGVITVDQMKKHGHHLPKLWQEVKAKDATLARFDGTIDALHKFESIRYPNEIIAKGLLSGVAWTPQHATTWSGSTTPPPKYEVIINTIDELVIELLQRVPRNPKFFVNSFKGVEAVRDALTYQNPQVAHWGL